MSDGIQFGISVDVTDAVRQLDKQAEDILERLGEGLHMLGEAAMTLSKAEFVPVVTGFLRSSGYVEDPVQEGDFITVNIGYRAPYSFDVHERPPSVGQGKNKFLEKAVMEIAKDSEQRLKEFLAQN